MVRRQRRGNRGARWLAPAVVVMVVVAGASGCRLRNAVHVEVGRGVACTVQADATVRCWGPNDRGQVGDGTTVRRATPVTVVGLSGVAQVAGGPDAACALRTDGTVACWGANADGQLGDGTTVERHTPIDVPALDAVADLALGGGPSMAPFPPLGLPGRPGGSFTCAVLDDGGARCWGANGGGQLGDGTTTSSASPVVVTGLDDAVGVSAGQYHGCAVRSDGSVACWGDNTFGQLGDGTTERRPAPVPVEGLSGVVEVTAGDSHTCARRGDGTVACWGDGAWSKLGRQEWDSSPLPLTVAGIDDATGVSAGIDHTCVLRSDGSAACWGRNDHSQLGTGTESGIERSEPSAVSDLTDGVALSVGGDTSCVATASGEVRCWGSGQAGLLGNGWEGDAWDPLPAGSPTSIPGTVVEVAAGGDSSCARLADGTIRCWGSNNGNGDGTSGRRPYASVIPGIADAVQVVAGVRFACVRHVDGTVSCWHQAGSQGLIGGGDPAFAAGLPVTIAGLADVVELSAGTSHLCARRASGTVACWGGNGFGQLGNGTTTSQSVPTTVPGLTDVAAISAGENHTCAVLGDGTARCWGYAHGGIIGTGAGPTLRLTPAAVLDLTGATDIAIGSTHTCALLASGAVQCWGFGFDGQLGNGEWVAKGRPVAVVGITDAVAVAAGEDASCAVLADGTARCWGSDATYQLGQGVPVGSLNTPSAVVGLSGVTTLALGRRHVCASLDDGGPVCWGHAGAGQGGGTAAQTTATPRPVLAPPI